MIDKKTPSALLFARVDTDSTQYIGKEVVGPVEFEGKAVIPFSNGMDVLRGAGVDRAGILAPDILFEPVLVRDLNMEAISSKSVHGVLNLKALRSLETPSRISLRRLK